MNNNYYNFIDSGKLDDIVTKEIISFGKLESGWDSGFGEEASQNIVQLAINVYTHLSYFIDIHTKVEAIPMTTGGIIIIFGKEDNFFDVIINPDETLSLRREKGFGENYKILYKKHNVTLNAIKHALCSTSESWILENTVQQKEGLTPVRSHHIKAVYQSSTPNVHLAKQVPYALIKGNTTQMCLQTQSFFVGSMLNKSSTSLPLKTSK